MSRDKHFPSDWELDDIKQLLGARTIHQQLGVDVDKSWLHAGTAEAIASDAVLNGIILRMQEIFGKYACDMAAVNETNQTAYRSMYDTAMMRIWWEKFGGTADVQRSLSTSEVGRRLGTADGTDADSAAQPHEEGVQGGTDTG